MAEEDAVQDNGTTGDVVLDGEKEKKEGALGEPTEADKQRFDSAYGRIEGMQSKIDGQDEKFSSLDDKLDTIIQTMATPGTQAPTTELDFTQDADYMPTTQAELDTWYDKRKTADIRADRDYSNAYTSQIDGLVKGEESKEVHDAIVKEMMDNFNVRHSDNGLMDADLNYSKASRSYYKKQLEVKGKTNPLTGPGKDNPPLGGGLDGEEMKEKETSMPKLDADAQAFIKETGMKEESVKAALTGETPAPLSRH